MVPAVTETETSLTPGMRRTAVSIFVAQEAQSMPSTRYRVCIASVMIRFLCALLVKPKHLSYIL
jgi:hypothetical protein